MRRLHVITIVFFALALSTTSAHVLEWLPKSSLPVADYAFINSRLYKYFAIIGGTYCLLSLGLGVAVAANTAGTSPARRYFLFAAAAQFGWLASWLGLVLPVNIRAAIAMRQSLASVYAVWEHYRQQWEFGHFIGFVFHLLALVCFLAGCTRTHQPDRRFQHDQ